MTRDEIKTLAVQLAKDLENADTLDIFINEVFDDVAKRINPPMLKAKIKALTSGTAEYTFETDMLYIHYLIMDDELLSPVNEKMLDAYSASWTTDTGTPTQYTTNLKTARKYTLYPIPDFNSDPLIPAHGEPFGEDYPDNSLVLIYSDDRESNIPSIFALPFAFDALAREFVYPSDHIDEAFGNTCYALSKLLHNLTELKDA